MSPTFSLDYVILGGFEHANYVENNVLTVTHNWQRVTLFFRLFRAYVQVITKDAQVFSMSPCSSYVRFGQTYALHDWQAIFSNKNNEDHSTVTMPSKGEDLCYIEKIIR